MSSVNSQQRHAATNASNTRWDNRENRYNFCDFYQVQTFFSTLFNIASYSALLEDAGIETTVQELFIMTFITHYKV